MEKNKIMDKVIITTEFVLKVAKFIGTAKNYAKLVNQSLSLGMFITTDENGKRMYPKPLICRDCADISEDGKCPNNDYKPCDYDHYAEYDKAKARVLFEGWDLQEENFISSTKTTLFILYNKDTHRAIYHYRGEDKKSCSWILDGANSKTIEDLAKQTFLVPTDNFISKI